MPFVTHEGLVLLFRNRPSLAADFVRKIFGESLPEFEYVRVSEADVTQLLPASFTTDLVVVLERGPNHEVAGAIILEPQLRQDEDKRYSWAVYVPSLRAKIRAPVKLVVVTIDESVARWARTPIETGHPGYCLTPLVLSPANIPIEIASGATDDDIERAILSIMVHGKAASPEQAADMAAAAIDACGNLRDERALVYYELIRNSLGKAARVLLEQIMANAQFDFKKEFARLYRAEDRARSVITVLEARGLPLNEEAMDRITDCDDLAILDRWLRKAVTVVSVDELFQE